MAHPRSIRVLLVEDQQLIRRSLSMLLATAEGIDVVAQAPDGETALAKLESKQFDVVLTDARMPGIDGAPVSYTHLTLPTN